MATAVEIVPPGRPLTGAIAPPGSKSITNRALLLAGLSKGTSRLTGALKSDDTRWMALALRAMGVTVEEPDATAFLVTGNGRLKPPAGPLFLGNAGTAMRFLTAAAALVDGTVVLDGDAHMRKRPIAPLIDSLRALGVDAAAPSGCPPVTVHGWGLTGGRVEVDASLSSQYVSALLMAAPCARAPVEVALKGAEIGARGYVNLTLAAMRRFGATVEATDGSTSAWRILPGGYRACDFAIEPDASAATYFWAAEALTGGKIDLGVPPAGFTQPDARAYDLIRMFPRMPSVVEGSQVQDAVPTLAVLAAFNQTPVRFTGIANLRVKECDRVAALATELSRLRPGLGTEEGDDLLVASDPDLSLKAPVRVETYQDHRIAMSLALAGLRVPGVVVLDPNAVNKTFPAYWDALASLGVELRFTD
ncbi:MAG TPA: 3-phosphoshikimate 1-carboxyvinyltransferase [Caulobacteraceae bacterium]|jgi:3-phosphoshikimate 1-carboxyvinyltransferase|nr:3-phosphoshikimate 1-carboxyvinyltransferase [Caulobacteraceae bacterium]